MMKTWAAVCAAVLVFVTTGCSNTVIGQPCVLVKKDPTDTDPSDGTRSIPIKWNDILNQQQKDFISFGATECEDLVCVLSTNNWPANPDPNAAASGECSTACPGPDAAGSCLTGTGVDNSPNAFTCRALVLDADTLASFKQSDPVLYQKYFGNTQSPYFCARPLPATGI
ncbi:MAG TPA: adventurous gliding motility lipoprotein CglC [Myxococcaceae bacterium]|jgi:hypothetical protein|nr:adventurous gliding motility lipoprotein CglC [Myxococcaceae bacterium]